MAAAELDRLRALLERIAAEGDLDADRTPLEVVPGEPASELARLRLAADGAGPPLFGRPLRLTGALETRVWAAAELDDGWPFPGQRPPLPEGTLVGRLEARLEASARRSRSRVRGPHLTLGLGGRSTVELGLWLALEAGLERRSALRRLLGAVRWPLAADLAALGEFEGLTLKTRATLDLGLGLAAGWRSTVPALKPLLESLGGELPATFDAVVRASFGLALDEEVELAAARAPGLTGDPRWVRLAVRRRNERRLTLGARFALDLGFDLGHPLVRLLDRALEHSSWRRFADALSRLEDLRGVAALAAEGRWSEVAEAGGEAGGELVAELLRRSGAFEHRDLERLLAALAEVGAAWRRLPGVVRDLWQELVDGAGLGAGSRLVEALETVAGLDEALARDGAEGVLEELLGEDAGRWQGPLAVLELLTGRPLEELVVAGDELAVHLLRAADLAARALELRDRVEDLPGEALAALRRALERDSLLGALGALASLGSTDDLARLAGVRAGALAERLLGRALSRATPKALDRLRRWAADLAALLTAPEHAAALRARVLALDGAVGCSLALELEWASRDTALLDLELDPAQPLAAEVLGDLADGTLVGALRRLDDAMAADGSPAFRLREGLFTSRRTRASAADLVLSLLGRDRDRTRRVAETWMRAETTPVPQRRLRCSAGLARRVELAGATATAEAWLSLRAAGEGLDPAAPFDGPAEAELRLSWSRHEPRLDSAGAAAIRGLLNDLGLVAVEAAPSALLEPGLEVRASATVRLGDAAARALARHPDDDPGGWLVDHVNALCRWLQDPAVPWSAPGRPEVARGAFIAAVLRSEGFRALRAAGAPELERQLAGRQVTVVLPDRNGVRRRVSATLVRRTTGAWVPHPAFTVFATSAEARRRGLEALPALAESLAGTAAPGAPLTQEMARQATADFLRLLARATVDDWPEPSLPCWLVLARLARLAPATLATATGSATLRARHPGEAEWAEVRTLRLANGLPPYRLGDRHGPFPVRS